MLRDNQVLVIQTCLIPRYNQIKYIASVIIYDLQTLHHGISIL